MTEARRPSNVWRRIRRPTKTVQGFAANRAIGHRLRNLLRQVVLLFALAAFAQANYLTQTHVHLPAVAAAATSEIPHDKSPQNDDPAHCPLCQEYLLAGAWVIPAPVVLPLPVTAAFHYFSFRRSIPFVAAASHDWHGRAPPLN